MNNFAVDLRQWETVDAFQYHLSQHNPNVCSWVRWVTIHHTWKPTIPQWRGMTSMNALVRFYQDLGWTSAPHLFICVGASDPRHDGIFQLTPLNMKGTHAGFVCNSQSIGIEVVGNYDVEPWSEPMSQMVCGTIASFMKWKGLSPYSIQGHRNCGSLKSCPGKAINISDVCRTVHSMMR